MQSIDGCRGGTLEVRFGGGFGPRASGGAARGPKENGWNYLSSSFAMSVDMVSLVPVKLMPIMASR